MTVKTENKLKSELVKEARRFGDYARRIEDKYTVGMPDILYGVEGGPTLLIEAKMITEKNGFAPTPRQHHELELWEKSGYGWNGQLRFGALLGFANGLYYLHPVDVYARISDCLVSDAGEIFPLFLRRYLK